MRSPSSVRGFIAAAMAGGILLVGTPEAQEPGPSPALREAAPDEVWITRRDLAGGPSPTVPAQRNQSTAALDVTPPSDPGNFHAFTSGLFRIAASWTASADPESGIDYYAFAIGTGTTTDTEANVRWWQSVGTGTKASVNMALTPGAPYYISVRANNGANLSSNVIHSAPLTAAGLVYGAESNEIGYTFMSQGISSSGTPAPGWSAQQQAAFGSFLEKMVPLLKEIYGPPSTAYTVELVRDLRYTSSAVFFPSSEEIHMGDTVTYQLLTHEMVHAFRRDRVLASGPLWEYESTLSGFEEGFAQAVSYQAMTEFARRYPSFGLTQQIYQSTHEWDYDFQNVPELGTTDFWSDSSGTGIFWARYEMAAAAMTKISLEHPGFARAFNVEYYRRMTANPLLRSSRALAVEIVAAVAPSIEGRAAADWIDRQYVFDCVNHVGRKIWLRTQHYPSSEYFIFQRTNFYETFWNGSEWAVPDGFGGYRYHALNGSPGTGTLHDNSGALVWQGPLMLRPVENPPVFLGFGFDQIELTTQASNEPWPGGDPTKFVTNLLGLGLYRLTVSFTAGATLTKQLYRVMGAPLRNTNGAFGGILGAGGGAITLSHRTAGAVPGVPVVNGAFWTPTSWTSLPHPETSSNDSVPGIVDVTYLDAAGNRYFDVRTIGYGSWNGNQAFFFDVSKMTSGNVTPSFSMQPASQSIMAGTSVTFSATASGYPYPAYQWEASTDDGGTWSAVTNSGSYSGAGTTTLSVASASGALTGTLYRLVATNAVGSSMSTPARLIVNSQGHPLMALDTPVADQMIGSTVTIAGWAIDLGAGYGTGIDSVHVWAFPLGGGDPRFLGVASYGQPRADLGAVFGARYRDCGFSLTATDMPPGEWRIITFVRNTITGTFADARVVDVTVGTTVSLPAMAIDEPQPGPVAGSFVVRGWAVDGGASSGTGVNAIHVWAFPAAGAPFFVGVAAHTDPRTDIGALFGPSFTNSGYSLTVSSLAPGVYDLYVFAHSTVTGTFNQARIVRVIR